MADGQTSSDGNRQTLADALLAAQKDMPAVEPDSTNPHFKSKFVSLGHLLSKVRPVLNRHGFTLVQAPTLDKEGRFVLRTRLIHKHGEVEFDSPLTPTKNDPQGQGSAITYMRRYALAAALAIADQEDDDGNAGSESAAPEPQANGRPPSLDAKRAEQIIAGFKALSLNFNDIGLLLGSCGIDGLRANSKQAVEERISSLTEDQATKLEAELDHRDAMQSVAAAEDAKHG